MLMNITLHPSPNQIPKWLHSHSGGQALFAEFPSPAEGHIVYTVKAHPEWQ